MAPSDNKRENEFFLPDFCNLRSVFAVVVLGELLAIILTLAATPSGDALWSRLSLYSLFLQWVGLLSAGLLCLARRPLSRFSDGVAGFVSYLLLLLTLILLSLASFYITQYAGLAHSGNGLGEYIVRNLVIGAIVGALTLRYFYVSHQWRQRIRAEARARLEALQARIRPHFLFNSINTVTSLIHDKPDEAEEALLDLADLFRASLREERKLIPLAEELELTRRYLNMESLRLGERLQLEWQLEQGIESLTLPPLILQPLVENAVYHGIEPRPEGGTVAIAITHDGQRLKIQVSNPLPESDTPRSGGNKLALANIRARLDAHYGEQASVTIDGGEGDFEVTLLLPAQGVGG